MRKVAIALASILTIGSAAFELTAEIGQDAASQSASSPKETILADNSKDVNIGSGKSIGSNRNNKDNGSGNVVIRGRDDPAGKDADCMPGTAGREGRVTRGTGNVIGDSRSTGKNSGKVTIRGGTAGKPGRCDDAAGNSREDEDSDEDLEEGSEGK
jgi:hypothetical protein